MNFESDDGLPFSIDDDDYVVVPQLPGEWNLWAAVVHRTLQDAWGYRLGSRGDSVNNYTQRTARKWFRDKSRAEVGGWGWIVDSLGIPPWLERRIARSALIDKAPHHRRSTEQ